MSGGVFVAVTGLPGSGKSTLGRAVAARLGLPMLDKDSVLEALFDSLGCADAEARRRLSRAADAVLRRLAGGSVVESGGAVIVSYWRHDAAGAHGGTAPEFLAELPGRVVELHCRCPTDVALRRFLGRARHPGHHDAGRGEAALRAQFAAVAALGPLGGYPLVEVDTAASVDGGVVADAVRRMAG